MNYKKIMFIAGVVNLSILFFHLMSDGLLGQNLALFSTSGVILVVIIGLIFIALGFEGTPKTWVLLACAVEKSIYTFSGLWFVLNHYETLVQLYSLNIYACIFLSGFALVDASFMLIFAYGAWYYKPAN